VNSSTLGTSSPLLLSAFDHQDRTFATAFSILNDAIATRAFPAASVAITRLGRLIGCKGFGSFTYDPDSPAATPETLFDLASLTKVIGTTAMAMLLYERGLLDLEAPVAFVIPEFVSAALAEPDLRRHQITLRMLLAHSSGLPAYEKLYLKAHTRDELLHAALTTPLIADPGARAKYSDIGFIVLSVALERLAGEPLDVFCQREIFGLLGMANTTFNPSPAMRPRIPPTADERPCGADTPFDKLRASSVREMSKELGASSVSQHAASTFRGRIIQGEVQDENASVLGGVAGHAGLFATAEDVARFAHALLTCGADSHVRETPKASETQRVSQHTRSTFPAGRPILRPETVSLFTRRETAPAGTSRALGWDTPSAPSQSGKYFTPSSFGHLGYTGTSLWIDPARQLSITLLTNRTWPDCSNQSIKQVRPRFHDAVIEAIGTSE